MRSAYVSEIYASVQGEGPYTGEPQVFFRLAGCPLRCNYCDTPESLTARGHALKSTAQAVSEVLKIARSKRVGTVSVTGGEPLSHARFLEEFLPKLRKEKLRIYLETAGVHPVALGRVVRYCDVIAMDIKLPSATGHVYWKEHKKFLQIGGRKLFVKVVIEKMSKLSEIKKAVTLLRRSSIQPLLVLQPATAIPPLIKAPSPEVLSAAYQYAITQLPRVLVMPQQHKLWSVR